MNPGSLSGFGKTAAVTGVTKAIVNAHSSGGTSTAAVFGSSGSGAREMLSGSMSAGIVKTMLIVNGAGRMPLLSAFAKDTTPRTIRLVVDVDGVNVFDATSASISVASTGIFASGAWTASSLFSPSDPIVFAKSLVVKVASSLTETDKVAIGYILHRN